jgi:hypothetical protein
VDTARKCPRNALTSPETFVDTPHDATFPTTVAEELSNEKAVAAFLIHEAVTEVPSAEIPTRGSPELSVAEDSIVVAPQFAVVPFIVAERERIKMGATARPEEFTVARAHTAVALVPSADTATVGFFE